MYHLLLEYLIALILQSLPIAKKRPKTVLTLVLNVSGKNDLDSQFRMQRKNAWVLVACFASSLVDKSRENVDLTTKV